MSIIANFLKRRFRLIRLAKVIHVSESNSRRFHDSPRFVVDLSSSK